MILKLKETLKGMAVVINIIIDYYGKTHKN